MDAGAISARDIRPRMLALIEAFSQPSPYPLHNGERILRPALAGPDSAEISFYTATEKDHRGVVWDCLVLNDFGGEKSLHDRILILMFSPHSRNIKIYYGEKGTEAYDNGFYYQPEIDYTDIDTATASLAHYLTTSDNMGAFGDVFTRMERLAQRYERRQVSGRMAGMASRVPVMASNFTA
ncbi:MAG: hypothetical protein H6865_02620 [Rhodospirillales bacterium]|nr:hypothetical protein [Alphaproteobacteria bacterium]MCB9986510.1 hypothetical protein [Rhodospirillales bacterium]USO06949.1 MAG: hypothetical protein H6866_05765 [Rhodospirillales bacterium]